VLSAQDVCELLGVKSESKNLDYKQSMNWATATAHQKAAVVKDALSMVNTQDGGKIIFGVRDADFEPIGMPDDDVESFDATRFADFLNRYADPSFACAVHKLTIDDRKFVVIDVPEFNTVPIICKADANDGQGHQVLKRGAMYIRTNRASSEAVPDAETMRELTNRAVVKRGDELLRTVERLIKGKPVALDEQSANEIMAEIAEADAFIVESLGAEFRQVGHWELEFSVLPYVRERITNLASISTLLAESQITLRGWYFPHFDQPNTSNFAEGVQSYMKRSSSGHLEGYRAYQSGTFVWRGTLWEDVIQSMRAGQKALSFVGVILSITKYFLFARRYYEKFAPDATVKLVIRLTDTQDRILASFNINDGHLLGEYICREPRVEVQTTCTVAELAASYDELARKATRRVYELFNWNNSGEEMIQRWQERLVNQRL
jgi:Putative DNA-binding domain